VLIDIVVDGDMVGDDGEAEISAWHVADGAAVTEDELIAEIETAKALVEIRSPAAGHLHHLRQAGDVVAAGVVIARIARD
jgi:pyruvate/2-oxoglutarate dehydrogenase complex dihydrolipoamide acyltransferase (E2) component